MYTIRLNHNGRVHCFTATTREGAFLMHDAMRAMYPLHDLTIWYGGTLISDQRIAA